MTGLTGRKALSHDRIVTAGSRAVRRAGFGGVSVADVMKEAGLTHGGFYAHFASRDELLAASVARAGTDMIASLGAQVARMVQAGVTPFRALVETYLYEDHIRDSENGCPVPALCAEAPRQRQEVGDATRRSIHELHKFVQQTLPRDVSPDAAWAIVTSLVGAVQLARAMGTGGSGRAVLASTRAELLARYEPEG
ncbi:MAG: TetR/AcrR family transcriptional regulator [Cupriavidus sp.]|nr:MAG: TetR/AcrR family transcriptional regulator [Cupriavidus sp.]